MPSSMDQRFPTQSLGAPRQYMFLLPVSSQTDSPTGSWEGALMWTVWGPRGSDWETIA